MPKMKTNRGAAKRFKKTGGGFKFKHATKRHILTKRTTKNKRQLRPNSLLPKCEVAGVVRKCFHTLNFFSLFISLGEA